jgi:hypothetical protein
MNVLGSTTYMYTIFNTNTKLLIWALTYSRSVTHTYVRVTNGADHSVAQVGVVGIHAHELTSWMCCHDGFVPTSVQQWSNDKIPRDRNTFSCYPWLGRKHGGGIRGRGYRVPSNCLLQQYYKSRACEAESPTFAVEWNEDMCSCREERAGGHSCPSVEGRTEYTGEYAWTGDARAGEVAT